MKDKYYNISKEKLDEAVKEVMDNYYRNELVVSQWKDKEDNLMIGYTIDIGDRGFYQTGTGGVKLLIDSGVHFTHVIFNDVELNEEQTESFWKQFKEKTKDEGLSES